MSVADLRLKVVRIRGTIVEVFDRGVIVEVVDIDGQGVLVDLPLDAVEFVRASRLPASEPEERPWNWRCVQRWATNKEDEQ